MDNAIYDELAMTVCKSLLKRYSNDIVSFYVGGSVARQEGAVLQRDNKCILMSDLDLYMVVKSNARAIQTEVNRLPEDSYGFHSNTIRSPLFHISIAVLNKNYFKNHWNNLRSYEFINSAKCIFGIDLRRDVAGLTGEHIDPVFTRRLLIERIMQQIDFVRKHEEDDLRLFFTCRNICELSSVILYSSGKLISSYRERSNLIGEMYNDLYSRSPCFDWHRIIESIIFATRIKLSPTVEDLHRLSYAHLVEELIYSYRGVFNYLAGSNERSMFDYSLKTVKYLPIRQRIVSILLAMRRPYYYKKEILTLCFEDLLVELEHGTLNINKAKPYYYRTRHRAMEEGGLR